jgi:hypothetical protein
MERGTHGNCYKVVSNAKPLLNRVPLHDIGQPVQLLSTCTFMVSHVLLWCYTGDIESISLALDAFDGTATPTAKGSQTCGSYHVVLNELQHVRKRVSQCNVGYLHKHRAIVFTVHKFRKLFRVSPIQWGASFTLPRMILTW